MAAREVTLFVYGTLLRGEPSHELLEGARFVAEARTLPRYSLVDLGTYPAVCRGGDVAIAGELWIVDLPTLAKIDVHEGHPVLFKRAPVDVEGDAGAGAEAYFLDMDQVRGRRRIRSGSWRDRDMKRPPATSARDAPLARRLRSGPR